MNWKKNGFSYVTWFLYLLITGIGSFCLVSAVGSAAGLPVWAETAAFGACFPVAGLLVFLLHRFAPKYVTQKRMRRTAAEMLFVVLLTAAGLFLRIRGISGMVGDSLYFDLASLDSAKQIPQFAHGAVYFYLRLLHTVFFFFGNEMLAAAWFQILAQTAAFLLLYFAARHMAGTLAALTLLGFCELSSYMTNSALTLSPDCLYLLFWAASLIWIVSIRGEKLDPVEFVPVGIFTALMGYVDVTGFLLLFLAIGLIFSEREGEEGKEGRKASLLVCLGGTVLFFFVFLFLDSILSKKGFVSVVAAWFRVYCPEAFRMPIVAGGSTLGYVESFVLFAFLLMGVFSFWRDGKRDSVKGWIIGVSIVVLGECFGIFTAEVPAATYLFILLALLAGIGVNECFRSIQPGMSALVAKPAATEKKAEDRGRGERAGKDAAGKEAGTKGEGTEGTKGDEAKKVKAKKEKGEDADVQRPSKKKADKKGRKAAAEKEAPSVKSDDVAAALFGGGVAKGAKPAANRESAQGGLEATEVKETGGVRSDDVAAALFGGSAKKPSASRQTDSEQETGERHFDGSARVLDQLTATSGDADGTTPAAFGVSSGQFDAGGYETDEPVSGGYGASGVSPDTFGTEGYEADRPVSGGYGTSGVSPDTFGAEGYEADGVVSGGYGTSGVSPDTFGAAGYEMDRPASEGYGVGGTARGAESDGAEPEDRPAATRFIENPLPLPKKHEKRQVDYQIKGGKPEDDYDYFVSDDDDFDI